MNETQELSADEDRVIRRLEEFSITDPAEQFYTLANCYFEGAEGLTRNETRSIHFYRIAVARGSVEALFGLAVCYENGFGVNEDPMEAFNLFQEAASKGNLEAIFKIACCYIEEAVVSRDEKKAVELFQHAAEQGHLDSMFNLAILYSKEAGTKNDRGKALKLLKVAANYGHLNAKKMLALTYATGMGDLVVISRTKSHGLFEDYAAQDDLDSRFIVSLSYLQASDERKGERMAAKHFRKGAKRGHLQSIYALAWCYQRGVGVAQDEKKAKRLFWTGFLKGYLLSVFALVSMDLPLTDKCQNAVDTFLWLQSCAHNLRPEWVGWGHLEVMNRVNDLRQKYAMRTHSSQNSEVAYLDLNDACDVVHTLAQFLAATFEPNYVCAARELVSHVEATQPQAIHSKWSRIFVKELCVEDELWCRVPPPPENVFVAYQDIIPLGLIGRGQCGMVYLAWQPLADRYVAVKCFPTAIAVHDERMARNTLREQLTCRVLASNGIRGTVKYLGYTDLTSSEQRGLVYELCADISEIEGFVAGMKKDSSTTKDKKLQDLPDWTKVVRSSLRSSVVFSESRRWTVSNIIRMLREAAEALSEVHELGFIHRDVAARNILCDSNGAIRLADFGLAKYVGSIDDDSQILTYYRKGYFSPEHQYALAWWAPECFGSVESGRDALFSCSSDVYSFGITIWQCFSHRDPFSFVVPEMGKHSVAVNAIETIIVKGKRPNLRRVGDGDGVLDADTPEDLIHLIDSCWRHDPKERPTLKYIIVELRRVENAQPTNDSPRLGRIAFPNACDHWFDIAAMYQNLRNLPNPGRIPSSVGGPSSQTPFDVFLVNAGEQKLLAVDTLKNILETGGLRCFLDREMSQDVSPTDTMRRAIRTCRYVVVVLSEAFFRKKHPSEELSYAFLRMKWIRQTQNRWESLRVILYGMTVEEYDIESRSSIFSIPTTLSKEIVVREWKEKGGETTWTQVCMELMDGLKEHDNEGAIAGWHSFLKQTNNGDPPPSDFPSETCLYT